MSLRGACPLLAKALTVDAPHIPSPTSFAGPTPLYRRPRVCVGSSSETTLEFAETVGAYLDGACDTNEAVDAEAADVGWLYGCVDDGGWACAFDCAGALRPMIKFVTLLAVDEAFASCSSLTFELLLELLPKPRRHLEGFFAMTAGVGTTVFWAFC